MDYYKILNVDENSSLEEIKRSYQNLSSFYNPSNNTSKNAYKKYREINKAYKVLSEAKQKEMYNLILKKETIVSKDNKGKYTKLTPSYYLKNLDTDYSKLESDSSINFKDVYISLDLPYLYYLTKSLYTLTYYKKEFIKDASNKVCPTCLGVGKVKYLDKICDCPSCFNHRVKGKIEKIKVNETITINDENIVLDKDDYKVYISINFTNKEFYTVKNNEIFIDYKVSEKEYFNGVNFNLFNNESTLNINSNDYSDSTYTFLDYIIHIHYSLTKYNGKDKIGYLVSDNTLVYLNPSDYSFTSISDSNHTLKVDLNNDLITLEGLGEKGYNASNGNLIINVIRLANKSDQVILFNKKIKKVSYNLFKLKGKYNNHKFTKNRSFDYDDNYLYLPSKAYKLKLKSYYLFKILLPIIYLLLPLILYFIMGFNLAYIITNIVLLILGCISINLIMEVKV